MLAFFGYSSQKWSSPLEGQAQEALVLAEQSGNRPQGVVLANDYELGLPWGVWRMLAVPAKFNLKPISAQV